MLQTASALFITVLSWPKAKLRCIDWPRLLKSVIMMSLSLRSFMRRLAFLLLPGFSNLGLAAATEPLFVANWLAQRPLFDWTQISVDGNAVRASNGRVITVDGDLTAAADCKSVFVLASFDAHAAARERRVIRWLKRLARFGVEIGGIENGSLVLAEAGLLNGHQVAVHWDNLIGFRERY